jgi:hypothetical protein
MNHAALRKIAAATAVICEHNGGKVDVLFLLKALYLADRQMLIDSGSPSTGDHYVSMPLGPVPSGTYDLTKGTLSNSKFQQEWDAAFEKKGHSISPKGKVSVECLSEIERKLFRAKIDFVVALDKSGTRVSGWMHQNCPEWEDPSLEGKKQKPLPLAVVVSRAQDIKDAEEAISRAKSITEAIEGRDSSLLSKEPILLSA